MPRRVVLVRHGNEPPDDRVSAFLLANGFEPVPRRPFAGDLPGEPGGTVAGSVTAVPCRGDGRRLPFHGFLGQLFGTEGRCRSHDEARTRPAGG